MRILAIESSATQGSVAASDDGQLLAEIPTAKVGGTARTLAPAIDTLLDRIGWTPQDTQLVAVTQGPGSFTGLRVGVTTAKTFAYAIDAPVVGINTLEVIAASALSAAGPSSNKVWAVLDAQRGQVFAASFTGGDGPRPQTLQETAIFDLESFVADLNPSDTVAGPSLERLFESASCPAKCMAPDIGRPTAATVARLAWLMPESARLPCWSLAPQYFRPSAAEEKLQR